MYHDAPPTTPPMITYLAQGGQQQPPCGQGARDSEGAHIGMACSARTASAHHRPAASQRALRTSTANQFFIRVLRRGADIAVEVRVSICCTERKEGRVATIPTVATGYSGAPARSRRRLERRGVVPDCNRKTE